MAARCLISLTVLAAIACPAEVRPVFDHAHRPTLARQAPLPSLFGPAAGQLSTRCRRTHPLVVRLRGGWGRGGGHLGGADADGSGEGEVVVDTWHGEPSTGGAGGGGEAECQGCGLVGGVEGGKVDHGDGCFYCFQCWQEYGVEGAEYDEGLGLGEDGGGGGDAFFCSPGVEPNGDAGPFLVNAKLPQGQHGDGTGVGVGSQGRVEPVGGWVAGEQPSGVFDRYWVDAEVGGGGA